MSGFEIESAAQWVAKLLVKEVQFLAGVSEQVENLEEELQWMQWSLWDADQKQKKSGLARQWAKKIKDFAQDAEDVIEMYILEVSRKRDKPLGDVLCPWTDIKWLLCFCGDAKTLHVVGRRIDNLTNKINQLHLRFQKYGIASSIDNTIDSYVRSERTLAEQRRTYSHTEDDIVDFNNEDVVHKLVTRKERVMVIHGMAGIGKTTLARKVIRQALLEREFDGSAWAYASQTLQLSPLCRDILLQLIPAEEENRKRIKELEYSHLLVDELHRELKKKKYLVVIDDIWSASDWKQLEPAFPLNDDSCRSKIIVTTRNLKILPTYPDDTVFSYEVQLLNGDESWELFQKKSKFNKDNADRSKVELGEKMLIHCNGLALAIVVLGGVLATKKTYEEWRDVYGNLPLHLQGDDIYGGVYGILGMSYYELPYNLKACFLLLGYFPEDFEIPAERIYHLWIAEGIVPSTQEQARRNRSMEDIAKGYLNELVQRGMVQVTGWHYADDHVQHCKLHDLMRDKCLEIAKEENFLQIVDPHAYTGNSNCQQRTPRDYTSSNMRRRAIYVGNHGIQTSLQNSSSPKEVSSLRSVLFFPINKTKRENCECIKKVTKDFPLLRILDFTGLRLTGSLPKSIGNLIYLRFLSLRGTCVGELPFEIGDLRSLLVLDLRVSDVEIKLPNVLWKIKSLKQLYFPMRSFALDSNAKQGYKIKEGDKLTLSNLGNLEMIEDVELDGVDVTGLLELMGMRKLGASCMNNKQSLVPFLQSESIETLRLKIRALLLVDDPMMLSGCHFLHLLYIDADKDQYVQVPINIGMFPQNLVELGFWYCQISEEHISVLEKLPRLKNFQLHICYQGQKMHFSSKGFPEVTHLIIDGLWDLEEWTVEAGGLPKLKKLEIYFSPIQSLPDTLAKEVDIACKPCVGGVEKYKTCPYFDREYAG